MAALTHGLCALLVVVTATNIVTPSEAGLGLDANPDWPYRAPERQHHFDVREFGGVGDGQTLNTAAFKAAVAAIEKAGEGQLTVPVGRFLTGPFNLTSHMTLWLTAGATILGTTDMAAYALIPPMPSYGQGRDYPGPRFEPLIGGYKLKDVAVMGGNGTIDGQGDGWWAARKNGTLRHTRGHLIEFQHSRGIEVSWLTLRNSPFWTVHPFACQDVAARNLTVMNPWHSPNTDGFDPDSTKNVAIRDSYFSTGDDGVAIKSGWDCAGVSYNVSSAHVFINNLTVISPTSAGVCIGSEMSGGVTNVTVVNSNMMSCAAAFRIKAARDRSAFVTDVLYENSTASGCDVVGMANDFYGGRNPFCNSTWNPPPPVVDNIRYRNIQGGGNLAAFDLEGLGDQPITRVSLDNVHIQSVAGFKCANVSGTAVDVAPKPCSQLTPATA